MPRPPRPAAELAAAMPRPAAELAAAMPRLAAELVFNGMVRSLAGCAHVASRPTLLYHALPSMLLSQARPRPCQSRITAHHGSSSRSIACYCHQPAYRRPPARRLPAA